MPTIDIHVHVHPLKMITPQHLELVLHSRRDYDQIAEFSEKPASFLKFLDEIGVERAAIINHVGPDFFGFPAEVNDWAASYCSADTRRLIAFGSVHPGFVEDAAREVDRLAKLGIRGLKLHPAHQIIAPNAYRDGMERLGVIYERAQAHGMAVMIHTGTSVLPGARNLYAQPMLADDVAVDFPGLTIILAHGGRPLWMNEAFFLVRRHRNVYIDVSSIPPQNLLEYFPRLEEIADKALFGSDWPGPGVPGIAANIRRFEALPLSAEAKRKILYDNAARLFSPLGR
jgi:uncharacterized protein